MTETRYSWLIEVVETKMIAKPVIQCDGDWIEICQGALLVHVGQGTTSYVSMILGPGQWLSASIMGQISGSPNGFQYLLDYVSIEPQAENMSVRDLEISTRAINALTLEGIETVADLANQTAGHLLRLPNFARKSLTEVECALRIIGMRLRA